MILILALLVMLSVGSGCQSTREVRSPETKIPETPLKMPAPKEQSAIPLVKVQDLVDAPDLVGQAVRVRGRCLGYGSEHVPGSPPRTRSDWALEDEGVAIYVTGPFPAGCSGLVPGEDPIMINAVVAVDTLTAYSDGSRSLRYFLVAIEAP